MKLQVEEIKSIFEHYPLGEMLDGEVAGDLTGLNIIYAMNDPVSVQDTEFKIIYQNRVNKHMFGEHVGSFCYRIYQNKDRVCSGCHLAMTFRDGQPHKVERSRIIEDGVIYTENVSSPLMDSEGKIVAAVEVVRDITGRKAAELALSQALEDLECRVRERTKELEESSTALKVLLKQREQDKKDLELNIFYNLRELVFPYLDKLKTNRAMSEELTSLNIIESNLREIVSPFSSVLSLSPYNFTPRELVISDLIKDGKQDKVIMEILNISLETVKTHRQNIRKKLGIYGSGAGLRSRLLSLM